MYKVVPAFITFSAAASILLEITVEYFITHASYLATTYQIHSIHISCAFRYSLSCDRQPVVNEHGHERANISETIRAASKYLHVYKIYLQK